MNYQTYEKLAHVGHKHYKDTNFCTVIAVASVTGMSFGKARIKMEKAGRPHRKGTLTNTFHNVIKKRGFDIEFVSGYCGHQVKTMGKKLGKGTYLVEIRNHVIAFVDGVCNDWSDGRSFKVICVHKVTKSN
tara:strand:- start:16048 stop:16440 length:393 start_codon:yes stop_codon:yes gene_type:complete